jgi:ABC-2 type transport system permease protein
VLTYGGTQTAQYPIVIYHRFLRRFFTWVVPIACVSYFPVTFALGIEDPLGSSALFQALAPLTGPAFLLATLGLWRLGERRYASTGS